MTTHAQEFTTPGAHSFVPDTDHVWVTILGGGGGGESTLPGNESGGPGGGSGEFVSMFSVRVTPGVSVPVVVGAGGAGAFFTNTTAPSGYTIATIGGDSSFGIYVALGGGNFETGGVPQQVAGYGGGVNGGLRGNQTSPNFNETIGAADGSRWFGGAGGGARADPNISPGQPGMNGGPSGGRMFGGIGGQLTGVPPPEPGPGGGGGATVYGVGGNGGDNFAAGNPASAAGTGGGGAGGTEVAIGVGPFLGGAAGAPGRVTVFWLGE